MNRGSSECIVGLYWDFENIHATVYDSIHGDGAFSAVRFRPHDCIVNIRAIIDYASTIGIVAINKAYANWQGFAKYRDDLNQNGLDLVQHFPRGMKNSTDIRLALDVLEDLHHYPHITHIIVVSSDSDFISLAQKVKQSGRIIIGIGEQENANPYWIQCCNEFKFYRTLLKKVDANQETSQQQLQVQLNIEDAQDLMLKCLRTLVAQRGENTVPRSSLKVLMTRNDPSFDEANFGFTSFSNFIDAFPQVARNIHNDSGGFVQLLENMLEKNKPILHDPKTTTPDTTYSAYVNILKKGNVRILPAQWWRQALPLIEQIFLDTPDNTLTSFDHLKQLLAQKLKEHNIDNDSVLVNKLRQNLFALQQFELLGSDVGIKLIIQPMPNGTNLVKKVERDLLKRLTTYIVPPIDTAAVAEIVYGDTSPKSLDFAKELINEICSNNTTNDSL